MFSGRFRVCAATVGSVIAMEKRLNSQALLEFICLVTFLVLTLYLVISGKYLSYVTPKMAPYLYFTAAVMLIWSISTIGKIFRPRYKVHAAHCLVLIVPIVFILLPHSSLSTSTLSSGYMDGNSLGLSGSTSGISGQGNSTGTPSGSSDAQNDGSIVQQSGLAVSGDGTINISDKEFYPWLSEIFTNMNKYEGTTITLKGFVFRDASVMSENEFVPARLLMYCCSADLTPCGMLCRYDNSSELADNAWITVTGIIHVENYNGELQPVITATSVSSAEKPDDEYVYPW